MSPTGSRALSISADKAILWDTSDWRKVRTLRSRDGIVDGSICKAMPTVSGDLAEGDPDRAADVAEELLVLAFGDDSVMAWDLHTLALAARLRLPAQERGAGRVMTCVATAGGGRYVAAGLRSGSVALWDLPTGALVRIIDLPEAVNRIQQVHFLPCQLGPGAALADAGTDLAVTGLRLAVLGDDGAVRSLEVVGKDV